MKKRIITTREEAKQYAIEWQNWAWDRSIPYSELVEWEAIFSKLADKFELREEFEENGII